MSRNLSGLFLLVVGPSGVGKGTAVSMLKERHPHWVFPVSATTRSPRPGEKDGETYHFLSPQDFDTKIENDEFLEWAWVHEKHKYGVLKSEVFAPLENGEVILREVDIQGFLSLRDQIPRENFLSFFLFPPSFEVLKQRIIERAPISAEELQDRFESMERELEQGKECDVHIYTVDGDVDLPVRKIETVLTEKGYL